MDEIKVYCLSDINTAAENKGILKLAANISMHGDRITKEGVYNCLRKPMETNTYSQIIHLPHTTLQKFVNFHLVISGASRRFLAQITRHQIDVKFMSMSLHYSDVSDSNLSFVTPRKMTMEQKEQYQAECERAYQTYKDLIKSGVNHNEAGYVLPQGMRNLMLISANGYQWKHMISQRVCKRNTDEMRYVMLLCWKALVSLDPIFFADCFPECCKEGKFSCLHPYDKADTTVYRILEKEYPDMPFNEAIDYIFNREVL